jgi:hypothetical protein
LIAKHLLPPDIITKVEQDFSGKSIVKTRAQLREVLDQIAEHARAQIAKG